MRIDRSVFLSLTATLAGVACAEGPAPPPASAGSPSLTLAVGLPGEKDPSYSAQEGGPATPLNGCGHSAVRMDRSKTSCTDDVGSPSSCAGIRRGGSCGPFPFVRQECNGWRSVYKPKIAERAVSCALGLSAEQVCDACYTYRCGYEALMSACKDPTATRACDKITAACPSAKADECVEILSGMTESGRSQMVSCMSGQGCSWGLYSCSEGLH